jgi:ABC-type tungstate transport system substrate-binding protein
MDAGLLGRVLLVAGIAVALVGGFLMLGGRVPFGSLPGDISVQGRNGSFFFPVVSCIVISLVLTVVLNIILRH